MLCKCSGKYIDIYFILKITFYVRAHQLKTPVVWGYLACTRPGVKELINDRLAHFISQDVSNPSFAAPLPVPVRQSPSHRRQDLSLFSPRTGYGNPEEPVQAESAISFFNSLRSAGIALPQGIRILDSGNRSFSKAVTYAASQPRLAVRSQGGGS